MVDHGDREDRVRPSPIEQAGPLGSAPSLPRRGIDEIDQERQK
jgi:hypothetical protein